MEGNNFKNEKKPGLEIETVKMPNGNSVSYCPERGIITSLEMDGGIEVLYMDKETLNDKSVNIKGGIPVLFPNAGPIPEELKKSELSGLDQHGFARKQKWESTETMMGIDAELRDNKETRKIFPYSFDLSLINRFERGGSFTVTMQARNFEEQKDMPVSFGLHPYFNAHNEQKKNIKFNFEGGKYIEENVEKWTNGEAISLANPGGPMEVIIPGMGTFILKASSEYKRIWIWSQPGKNFICIEPIMRDNGGIVTDPEMVKPYQKISADFNIYFKKE